MVVSVVRMRNRKVVGRVRLSMYCVVGFKVQKKPSPSSCYLINGHIACPDRVQSHRHVVLGPVNLQCGLGLNCRDLRSGLLLVPIKMTNVECLLELETKVKRRFAMVSIVSYSYLGTIEFCVIKCSEIQIRLVDFPAKQLI